MTDNLFERLLKFTQDGIYRYSFDDGTIIFANEGFLKIIDARIAPDSAVGRKLSELIEYTEKEGTIRNLLLRDGEIHDHEYHFRTLGGQDRWVLHNSFIITEPDGKKIVEAIVRDITERKNHEFRITEEKEKLCITLNSIGDAVIATGVDERVTLINPVAEKLTGWTASEAVGRPLGEVFVIINETTRKICEDPVKLVLKSGRVVGLANHTALISRDGSEKIIADSGAPILNSRGEVIGVILVFRDITEEKFIEKKLREVEAEIKERLEKEVEIRTAEYQASQKELQNHKNYLDAILNSVNDPIFVKDEKHRWVFLNECFCKFMGYGIDELLGKSDYDFFPKSEADVFWKKDQTVFDTGVSNENEEYFTSASGVRHTIVTKKRLLTDSSGNKFIVGVIRDITEMRKMEEELVRSSKLESLGVLAGGIAHDFNNFLTIISGNISLAMKKDIPESRTFELLARAENISLRARDLTNQLIAFARGGKPVKKLTRLDRIIKDSAQFALSGSNISCRFTIPNALWSSEADEGQLLQVITNLAVNSKQAMPDGGSVEIGAENLEFEKPPRPGLAAGRYVRIFIRDTGCGITEENLPKIFDPFFTTKPDGTGLGLTTTYSIVRNHDGYLAVDSKPGEGTTFSIFLPARYVEAPPPAFQPFEVGVRGNGEKILLVDDDENILVLLYEMLTGEGYEAIMAHNGDEAISFYCDYLKKGTPFDLIIMDLIMRNSDSGHVVFKKIRKLDEKARAIVSSGYSNDAVMANHKEYGFSGVLAKPYRYEAMLKLVRDVIKAKNA